MKQNVKVEVKLIARDGNHCKTTYANGNNVGQIIKKIADAQKRLGYYVSSYTIVQKHQKQGG